MSGALFDKAYRALNKKVWERTPAGKAQVARRKPPVAVKPRRTLGEAGEMPGAEAPGGDPAQQFHQIWLAAKEHFDHRADETVNLPEDSMEKSKITAAVGLLQQYEIQAGTEVSPDHVREHAELLADKLEDLFTDREMTDPTKAYSDKFAQSLREFAATVEHEDASPEPSPEGGPEGPPSPEDGPEGAPEGQDTEGHGKPQGSPTDFANSIKAAQ